MNEKQPQGRQFLLHQDDDGVMPPYDKFEALHDGPLRAALDTLQTLDTIRIIEGKV
jgi:hypothetical protein